MSSGTQVLNAVGTPQLYLKSFISTGTMLLNKAAPFFRSIFKTHANAILFGFSGVEIQTIHLKPKKHQH